MTTASMFASLQKRSSWQSSLVTGLVGWVGFTVVDLLAFGWTGGVELLLGVGLLAAVAQVAVLRLGFRALRMERAVWVGALWGAITGAAVSAALLAAIPALRPDAWKWMVNGLYIGPAVGAFLSYFHRDDRRIEASGATTYGRDAHWLDPFAFGAAAYLLVFLPRGVDLAAYVFVVGAITGVVAAGVSHFTPDRWKTSPMVLVLLGVGALAGAGSALLLRNFAASLWAPHLALGAAAGALTFVLTVLRGLQLARREGSV